MQSTMHNDTETRPVGPDTASSEDKFLGAERLVPMGIRGPAWGIRRLSIALALLGGLTLLTGCLEDLPRPSKVDTLRTLAISAEPPEAGPGQTVALTALAVDVPDDRPISYRWAACLLPERAAGFFGGSNAANSGGGGYGLGDPGNCVALVDAGDPEAIDLGSSPTAELPIPADFFDDLNIVKIAYGLPTDAEIPDILLTGLLAIAGMNLTVTLEIRAGDDVVVTYKRVNISLAFASGNTNPDGIAFALTASDSTDPIPTQGTVPSDNRCFVGEDDGTVTLKPGTWKISPVNIPDPGVKYQVILPALDPEEPFELIETEETYFHSFFSTAGAFERDIIKATTNTSGEWVIEAPLEGPVQVWIVTRDGRGGASWCYSVLQPAAP